MYRRTNRRQVIASRAGLAPLEFVLSLPLLLMIMAMIIIVGTAGSWKVRTLANSRQAAARSIWPRDGANDPRPASWWPDSATMSAGGAEPDPFDYDPFSQHTVVRGPVVGTPGGGGFRVNTDLLDISRGMLAGHASIDRDLPLWRQLPWRNRYRRSTHVFSGDQWQFALMNLEDNTRRRIPVLYPDYNLASNSGVGIGRTSAALQMIMSHPDRARWLILDRDPELRGFYGDQYDSSWYGRYDRFNFHPPARESCTIDLSGEVELLKRQIEGVPCTLANAFLQLYRDQGLDDNDPRIQQLLNFQMQQGCN